MTFRTRAAFSGTTKTLLRSAAMYGITRAMGSCMMLWMSPHALVVGDRYSSTKTIKLTALLWGNLAGCLTLGSASSVTVEVWNSGKTVMHDSVLINTGTTNTFSFTGIPTGVQIEVEFQLNSGDFYHCQLHDSATGGTPFLALR